MLLANRQFLRFSLSSTSHFVEAWKLLCQEIFTAAMAVQSITCAGCTHNGLIHIALTERMFDAQN